MDKEITLLQKEYRALVDKKLDINMERGWPCNEQLQLAMPMLDLVTSDSELCREVDYRGYAGTAGIEPIKKIFADLLCVDKKEIYVGGTMSTSIMYDIVNKAVLFGIGSNPPWKDAKFICPSPGYEKHFKICQTFGIQMISVDMLQDGPDMDTVEKLVQADETIKGIWCVPMYSNPTGAIYSDEVVMRLAKMKTKANDFKIFWDNAYCVHHLTDEIITIKNILTECKKYGNEDRVFEFASTSKMTFPGGGVAACASSENNIQWLTQNSLLQLKSGDKINQFRHALFLRDMNGIYSLMKKHRNIIKPKFDIVDKILHENLDGWNVAKWIKPKGGYFINIELSPNLASRTWQLCKEAGVRITPAGSMFPYGIDKRDSFLRLAPTFPTIDELKEAINVLCVAIKLAYLEQKEDK